MWMWRRNKKKMREHYVSELENLLKFVIKNSVVENHGKSKQKKNILKPNSNEGIKS
jgi:hypothetical protein